MRVSVKFGSYNFRRYGRPWIGRITSWPVGGKAEIAWGSYIGDNDGGECEINAQPGDIIRAGQRDNRGNGGSNDWYVVSDSGQLYPIDQPEARELWTAKQANPTPPKPVIDFGSISNDDLWDEVVRRGLHLREVSNG